MSTASNITIADATSPTPVNHNFVWSGVDPKGVSRWVDRTVSSQPIGAWEITMSQREPVRKFVPNYGAGASGGMYAATGVYRDTITLRIPVLEVVSNSTVSGIAPAPTVSHVCQVRMEFLLPERSEKITRQHIAKMAALLLQNAQSLSLLTDLDQPRSA